MLAPGAAPCIIAPSPGEDARAREAPLAEVELRSVSKRWAGDPAVDRVSCVVRQGSLGALLGPSGCGKSTTLRLVAGLESVTSGAILIGRQNVTNLSPAKRRVSMVFQSYALFPHLTVAENIVFGLRVRGVPRGERNARLRRAVDLLALGKLLERKPFELSGGQQQRVALGRPSSPKRPSVSWMSRSPIWTRSCASKCAARFAPSSSGSASPCCMSPTISWKP
jgi:ABC-type sugar transport system ATPase subunit